MGTKKNLDLSRVDFSRLVMPDWYGCRAVAFLRDGFIRVTHGRETCDIASRGLAHGWSYSIHGMSFEFIEFVKKCTDRVDEFILGESARIASEDEAANWVPVPWQDVEWLIDRGTSVSALVGNHRWALTNAPETLIHDGNYLADCRTFPVEYDPAKPRWVEIDWTQVERLDKAGCQLVDAANKSYGYQPRKPNRGAGKRDWCYAVDIHTLPPGVPLHVEAEKPKHRPCTREFALAHSKESEMQWWVDDASGGHWSGWYPIGGLGSAKYEFRTTAPEEPVCPTTVKVVGCVPLFISLPTGDDTKKLTVICSREQCIRDLLKHWDEMMLKGSPTMGQSLEFVRLVENLRRESVLGQEKASG